MSAEKMTGYLRSDGRKGIRNSILVVYLVECAHHVAKEIGHPYKKQGVQVVGFGGCYPNAHADKVMRQLCTHPNVGGVLLVSLGCESFNRHGLAKVIEESGRPVEVLTIQKNGGTLSTIEKGQAWLDKTLVEIESVPRTEFLPKDLIVGTICGGSDATSGITANPLVGHVFDKLVDEGATTIFEETGEMIGCADHILERTSDDALRGALKESLDKAARYYTIMGHGSFAPGNADGGLTTIEEKSLGAYSKSGSKDICGIIKPGDPIETPGLYLLDVVPDGEPRFGFPNINDNSEITEMISSGCHVILFTTGRGSVVGSAISPVIKICANPQTYKNLTGDMDINAGKIIEEDASMEDVTTELYDKIIATTAGEETCSEALGHQEFVLVYKTFEHAEAGCHPG